MEDFILGNEEIRTVLEDSENVNIESIEYVDLKAVIRTSRYLKDNLYNLFNNKTFEHFISEKSKKVSEENCMLISMDFYQKLKSVAPHLTIIDISKKHLQMYLKELILVMN